jgi:hypothetical protein
LAEPGSYKREDPLTAEIASSLVDQRKSHVSQVKRPTWQVNVISEIKEKDAESSQLSWADDKGLGSASAQKQFTPIKQTVPVIVADVSPIPNTD